MVLISFNMPLNDLSIYEAIKCTKYRKDLSTILRITNMFLFFSLAQISHLNEFNMRISTGENCYGLITLLSCKIGRDVTISVDLIYTFRLHRWATHDFRFSLQLCAFRQLVHVIRTDVKIDL